MNPRVMNFIRYYLIWTSFLMIFQVLYYGMQLIFGYNLNAWIATNLSEQSNVIFHVSVFLFFFGFYNIIICGASGIILLMKRTRLQLAFLCLTSSLLFYLLAREVGDSL